MLHKRKIPVQAGLNQINPRLDSFQSCGLTIPRETMDWNHSQSAPRRALLNNFGAAGSNASLVLEEWVKPPVSEPKQDARSAHVFLLSAKSELALQIAVQQHIRFLENPELKASITDLCYTATARRQIYDFRIALPCTSVDDLRSGLETHREIGFHSAQSTSAIVFVFSGQGGVYHGMGEELMHTAPLFRELIMNCEHVLQSLGFPSILNHFRKDHIGKDTVSGSEEIIAAQCACVALEYALAKLLMSWNIMPKIIMGHRYVDVRSRKSSTSNIVQSAWANTLLSVSQVH